MDPISVFKSMVLNMSLGGGLTEKQINYIVNWVMNNFSPVEFEKLATIAWQYDSDELRDILKTKYDEFMDDEDTLTTAP